MQLKLRIRATPIFRTFLNFIKKTGENIPVYPEIRSNMLPLQFFSKIRILGEKFPYPFFSI